MESPESIRQFWFGNSTDDAVTAQQRAKCWWSKDPAFDREVAERYADQVVAAGAGSLNDWAESVTGLQALILLTDQFPRHIYRNTPQSFALDPLAQQWCLSGVKRGVDRRLRPIERVFFYLPLEHSESAEHQALSVQLFTKLYQEVPANQMDLFRGYLIFALRHRRIIDRFGRFPHRNAVLGRDSTPQELAFLQEPGSSF